MWGRHPPCLSIHPMLWPLCIKLDLLRCYPYTYMMLVFITQNCRLPQLASSCNCTDLPWLECLCSYSGSSRASSPSPSSTPRPSQGHLDLRTDIHLGQFHVFVWSRASDDPVTQYWLFIRFTLTTYISRGFKLAEHIDTLVQSRLNLQGALGGGVAGYLAVDICAPRQCHALAAELVYRLQVSRQICRGELYEIGNSLSMDHESRAPSS